MDDATRPTAEPVSLRDRAPHAPLPAPRDPRRGLLVIGAVVIVVFLLACVLTTPLGDFGTSSGDRDSLSEDEVRQIVAEVVGTQLAALPMSSGDAASVGQLQQMIDASVGTQVASLPMSSGDAASDAQIQQMIDASVGTKVAALVPTNTPIPPTPTVIPVGVAEDDDAFRGPADAPVVIVEFSDFQCGYCGRWYQDTLPEILAEYPTQVKFVYRDFPIFGDDSVRAAMATECAEDQGKFWEMHNRLFDRSVNQEQVSLSQESLVGFAEDLGMDARSFGECLSSEKYLDEVIADYQAAANYQLRGTPGFVINGVVYAIGAQPFQVFDGIIQSELARQGIES